jgi:hypothetical protein
MAAQLRLGRPRKYGRPSRAVTVTLPEDTLARLASVHADIGSAIVNLVERRTPTRVAPMRAAEVTRFGSHAVIVVTPSPALRRLRGVHLVPVGDGRALISLTASTSIQSLELQVRDALERLEREHRDREGLESVAEILRRGRGDGGFTPEPRTIIVLASKSKRKAS